MNLTAVKDAKKVIERNVEESLAVLPPLWDCYRTRYGGAPSHEKLSLVDVGTGAGLPRVVLAIACLVGETVIQTLLKADLVKLQNGASIQQYISFGDVEDGELSFLKFESFSMFHCKVFLESLFDELMNI
ncbi:uncharacterized protein LOC130934208 [Arachis stenosperma]|uniref:uncharacterized protein LOC130934208 n=1 Tax=Arachis stenosperma TaxID=217475 RepID=UPI0025AC1A7F|nr:uncharacterized protein LOC130934208 [Arachis stenosperma]